MQRNALLVVHPLAPNSQAIGKYDVIALQLIERIEQRDGRNGARAFRKERKKS